MRQNLARPEFPHGLSDLSSTLSGCPAIWQLCQFAGKVAGTEKKFREQKDRM